VAVIGLGVLLFQAGGNGAGGNTKDSATSSEKMDAAADPIAPQVRELLSGTATHRAAGESDSPMLSGPDVAGGTAPPRVAPASVPACVLKATQRTAAPLAAERESFKGTDSYLVVLPHPDDASLVDAFVVSASCTATSPGAVLFRNTYPR
jgi:hypothetical protein